MSLSSEGIEYDVSDIKKHSDEFIQKVFDNSYHRQQQIGFSPRRGATKQTSQRTSFFVKISDNR